MATEFKILRGYKDSLIDEYGKSKLSEDKLVDGYWYLTNDTAEAYVALDVNGELQLKKINDCCTSSELNLQEIENLKARTTELENKTDVIITSITAIEKTIGSRETIINDYGIAIAALQNKTDEIVTLIQNTTTKFEGYYTAEQVDLKFKEAFDAVDLTTINAALDLKANINDVYTKEAADLVFMTEKSVDDRIYTLIIAADPSGRSITNIQNLVKYVDENAGEIAALVTAVGEHTTAIAQNASDIIAIKTALDTVVQPKESDEISVSDNGTLGIKEISTDKLVQGNTTLVLNGGCAS